MSLSIALTEDIATCHALRRAVFVEEQGVSVIEEVDGRDGDALHLLARKDGRAVGCARVIVAGTTGKIGRVCVLADQRGQGIGIALIEAALDCMRQIEGVTQAQLGAQIYAIGFYERLGFIAVGPEYLDAGIAHRDMLRPV
ncbi:GNAT family N-acetyltransferase [Roseinatronobacter alkalisoli]|uniref:GNAT family N-acetyltransferase n=1 Tax=Roseinatronobacter alkalisoli TaxID=3028235 RepID=A0ABT5TCR4_9RHOB|nr:GNAT family N-acetyltransferase [Roseinatronobacter sp. HJB301]MDD7971703.1 GNAT family N-acetyltransferase [Roseinatronobacter sp. HJB301]